MIFSYEEEDDTMKRKFVATVLIVVFVFALMLTACSKPSYGLSDGTYTMSVDNKYGMSPAIVFEKDTFLFTFDPLSSYANLGAIEIKDGNVVAKTDDGNIHLYI